MIKEDIDQRELWLQISTEPHGFDHRRSRRDRLVYPSLSIWILEKQKLY